MISTGPREIGDAAFRLREITPADSEGLYRWRTDPNSLFAFRSTEPIPFETHAEFVARYFSQGNTDRWFIIEAEGQPVGSIALYGISGNGREAEWGRFVVAPEHRGRGHGRRALDLLILHAGEIGVETLCCEVVAGNDAAERLYADAGFREKGRETADGRVFRLLVRSRES